MAKLPDPSQISRKTPTPGGAAGYLKPVNISTPRVDTSVGDALMNIGDEAYKFAMQEKARLDDVALDDAKNQYIQEALNIENEYTQIKGKAAVDQDIVKDYTTKLDGMNEKLSAGFKNDSQRRAWESYYKQAKTRFTANVMKHKLTESDQYAAETYKSTNITRTQNAHSNWADAGTVNSMASDIVKNVAKEKQRAGWGEERTEVELKSALGPLWSGVAAQYINAKQYKMAKKILDQHQEVIGVDKYTSYHKSIEASEAIDLSQEKAARILETVKGDSEQRKAAREIGGVLGDKTLERVKTFQNEQRIQRQEDKRVQSENDLKWVSDFGVEALGNETLTVEQVKQAGLSDENEALWMTKVFNQGAEKNKDNIAKDTNDIYAYWIEEATINPERWKAEDVAKDINPNGGGLSGPQFNNIVNLLSSNKASAPKSGAKVAAVRGKAQLKSMYDRGDFGTLGSGKKAKKTEAWETYSNILIEYQQRIIDEPETDHTDWLNNRIEEEGVKILYKKLDNDWGFDDSDKLISEWLTKHGKAVSERNIRAVRDRYQFPPTKPKLHKIPSKPGEK